MRALRRESRAWVWLALLLADLGWELAGYFVRGGSWQHETLSQVVKRWEGIDPVTGRPIETTAGLVKRAAVALSLVALCVALVLHWVVQVY